jgi:hypothetical protein
MVLRAALSTVVQARTSSGLFKTIGNDRITVTAGEDEDLTNAAQKRDIARDSR